MSRAKRLGDWGEDLAAAFLSLCGYRCLSRRYRRPGGEIDLVVRSRHTLVFVEVKTRGRSSPAAPEAWIDARKLARLRQTARRWLQEHPTDDFREYRFDVVAVQIGGEDQGLTLRHYRGV